MPAVRQVVFADVQIKDVGQSVILSFTGKKMFEKFKNQPRPLLRPRSVNFRQHFRNLSRKTVPLNKTLFRFLFKNSDPISNVQCILYTAPVPLG